MGNSTHMAWGSGHARRQGKTLVMHIVHKAYYND